MRPLRRIRRGTTYLITKKCTDDLFLIVPSAPVNSVLLYTLLLKAQKYGIRLHAFCFMSNHFHLVVTDAQGTLPAFMRDFLCNSSKALQVVLQESRRIWCSDRYSSVSLLDCDAAERTSSYSHANPTQAGRVSDPRDWPGLTTARFRPGSTLTAKRPDIYFSPRYSPAEVSARLEPVNLSYDPESSSKASADRIDALTAEHVKKVHATMRLNGTRFAGALRSRAVPRSTRGTRKVGTAKPLFATKNTQLMAAAIREHTTFHEDHREAQQRLRAGERDVVFPSGTYGYRVLLGVRVREAA